MTKMLRPRYWLCALAVGLALSAVSTPARAGTQATPNGLADFMAGVLPPPGTYWLNYLAYVNKSKLMDNEGDEVDGVDFKATAFVEAARFVWMSPYKLFGATYGAQVIFPFYSANVKVTADTPYGEVTVAKGNSNHLGDVVVNPLILAWHFSPNFHMGAALDIILPTGKADDRNAAAGLGATQVVTFEPLVAVSYWQPGGIDLSAKIMYDFHGGNRDTDTVPGQEFHFDFGASWGFGGGDAFRAGLAGFAYWQVTPDKIRGQEAGEWDGMDNNKSRQFAIGPAFKWWPGMGPFSVEGKAMWEFKTKNDVQGYTVWLNSILAL